MKFLEAVANDIRTKIQGNDLSHLTVVFPSKRASLFFNEFLVKEGEILWSPKYLTISELFSKLSNKRKVDDIEAIIELYHLYKQHKSFSKKTVESIAAFYGWGEKLLADFDDIDKNLADAQAVFSISESLGETNSRLSDFTEEEQEILVKFFRNSTFEQNSDGHTLKHNFYDLYQKLGLIYQELKTRFQQQNIAYEGALYRDVIDQLQSGALALPQENERYAFVGFNVLDKVEEALFSYLHERDAAWFYWDYDEYYIHHENNLSYEAGAFIKENLQKFPNALTDSALFNQFESKKNIHLVQAPGENAQAYNLHQWINPQDPLRETAIVLCNENLLEPVLHSIPENITDVNITKGFPIAHTFAYYSIEKLLREEANFTQEMSVAACLNKLKELDEKIRSIAKATRMEDGQHEQQSADTILHDEAFFAVHTGLTRLSNVLKRVQHKDYTIALNFAIFRNLVLQIIRSQNIPLKGEPIIGLQIMGLLETRSLDFKNIVLLSANEGMLPTKNSNSSFIPFIVRKYYHLTLPTKRTSVFAYYFYRMLQRAENITICYNGNPSDFQSSEPSRFILQLLSDEKIKMRYSALTEAIRPKELDSFNTLTVQDPIKKARFSASELNVYLDCPLQYYLKQICKIEKSQFNEGIDYRVFGTLFHATAERIIQTHTPYPPTNLPDTDIYEAIHYCYDKYNQQVRSEERIEENFVVNETIKNYIKTLYHLDCQSPRLQIEAMEEAHYFPLCINNEHIKVGGIIDRLDSCDGNHRIVDYKTGKQKTEIPVSIDELFDSNKEKRSRYYFQTLLYCCARAIEQQDTAFYPALIFMPNANEEDYNPCLAFKKKDKKAEEEKISIKYNDENFIQFKTLLFETIKKLLESTDFSPNYRSDNCKYCDLIEICKPNI